MGPPRPLSAGTRLVLGFLLLALVGFAVLRLYGGRSLSRRGPDSPAVVAREAIQADNTIVGLVGGLQRFEPLSLDPPDAAGTRARLEARVVGSIDSGRMTAELEREADRWILRRATLALSDGTTLPVAGSARY